MNIITYRGPGMPGGLSNSVGQAWHTCADSDDQWWNIEKNFFQCLEQEEQQLHQRHKIRFIIQNNELQKCKFIRKMASKLFVILF